MMPILILPLLLVLFLNGCATAPPSQTQEPAAVSVPEEEKAAPPPPLSHEAEVPLKQEIDALLQQKYIDPLTRFIQRYAGNDMPEVKKQVARLRLEREKRCGEVARIYEGRPKTVAMLKRLSAGYTLSCPRVVEEFAQQIAANAIPRKKDAPSAEETAAAEAAIAELEARGEEIVAQDFPVEAPAEVAQMELSGAVESVTDALEDCRVLYEIKNYLEAVNACEVPAKQGNADAQYRLGMIYRLLKSYDKAIQWIDLAVEQGFSKAQFVMGQFYYNGQGVERDYAKAAEWFGKAAAQDVPEAQLQLAELYRQGQGVPAHPDIMLKWLRLAAENGESEAQLRLGRLYLEGTEVPADPANARNWLHMAAEQGDVEARYQLGMLYADSGLFFHNPVEAYAWLELAVQQGSSRAAAQRDLLASGFTPEQLRDAQQRSQELIERFPR